MSALLSFLTAAVCAVFALQLGRQFAARRRPHQLIWGVAVLLFGVGVACQFLAEVYGWSPRLYRLWYLSGAVLTAAFLGQGSLALQAGKKVTALTLTILALASAGAALAVFGAPVDLQAGVMGDGVVSGAGMPGSVRLLTPFFNIYGTVLLVGGAARSSWFFLWNGGDDRRALGTALIAAGSFIVALGGTLSRFDIPQPLYVSEFAGLVTLYAGFVLTNRPSSRPVLRGGALLKRRKLVSRAGVAGGAFLLLGAVASLPLMPWPMGIVTDAQHVYAETLPEENRGAYLLTKEGVMQLYTWKVQPPDFPDDAPVLSPASVQSLAVVQKQLEAAPKYHLYNVETGQPVEWRGSTSAGMQLTLQPPPLSPGKYMLVAPTDSMFGGKSWHYFQLE